MAGYLVFDLEITDPAAWEEYRREAGPVMDAAGGHFVMASASIEPLEGDWHPASLSVVAFPSYEAARAYYHSPPYQSLVPLRQRAARGHGVLIKGL
ncbi:DUF1330 domain-containing protein [Oceanicola sp. S124]|uniref:DUF1330 domain-containing protein n=1 Tax=Oceanicola sp. S124 TaxID=1042378 RepID=UPI0002557D2C|nr:DUF1330 domain-containing protein [Oceanicola sp. S124]